MRNRYILAGIDSCIAVLAAVAASAGIFSGREGSSYTYRSIRGEDVLIYGKGIYRHMSAEVAIQGIAQDYVTLFLAVPLLIISLYFSLKGSLRWFFIHLGTSGYFFISYLFYLMMAMFNEFFLVYSALMGLAFFSLMISAFSMDLDFLRSKFSVRVPVRIAGGFLVTNSLLIAFLWLSQLLPPLLSGSLFPAAVEHYTTLVVQGLDLGLLLPLGIVSGVLLIKKKKTGFLMAPSYLVFLSLLMTALIGKIIYMSVAGYNVIPAIFIIPALAGLAILAAFLMIKNVSPAGAIATTCKKNMKEETWNF